MSFKYHSEISCRSYARRIGRTMSKYRQDLITNVLPAVEFNELSYATSMHKYPQTILEIGFGMGEHLIHQALLNPDVLHIGIEVYMNGVAKVLAQIQNHEIENILIWPNNMDYIIRNIRDNSISTLYILFPDPWPKKQQHKKRLFNKARFAILGSKLRRDGKMIFSSDIEDYFINTLNIMNSNSKMSVTELDHHSPYPNYIKTKYHIKAVQKNRQSRFVQVQWI